MEGSAVYLSFARRGASPPPQDVQVETHLSKVGGASLSRSRGRANGTQNPGGCHPWRENEEGVKIIPAQNDAGVDSTGNLAERLKDGGLKDRTSGTIFARDWPLVFPSRPTSARLETAAGSRRCCAGRPSHGRQRAR